jgi:hypothetical protein
VTASHLRPFLRYATGIALSATIAACTAPVAPERAATLHTIDPSGLCVTEGQIQKLGGTRMEVASPAMRAVVAGSSEPVAQLGFVYQGPSAEAAPLGSGELRRQIGLKLRAADTCNVIYIMWHVEPDSKLSISVKQNPGMRRHAECRDAGYREIRPEESKAPPRLQPGDSHLLEASMRGDHLVVLIDHEAVWRGDLGKDVASLDGPVGLRTDNARFAFELAAVAPADPEPDCRKYASD